MSGPRCTDPTCYVHEGETCARGEHDPKDCEMMKAAPAEQHAPEHVTVSEDDLADVERLCLLLSAGGVPAGSYFAGLVQMAPRMAAELRALRAPVDGLGTVDPLTVKCPRCDAEVHAPCFSVGPDSYNRGAPLKRAHPERYAAARSVRLSAPVDVDAELDRIRTTLVERVGGPRAMLDAAILALLREVRPHVERAAVLAREAEGLRAEVAEVDGEADRARTAAADWASRFQQAKEQADTACAEIERMRAGSAAAKESIDAAFRDTQRAEQAWMKVNEQLREARAEIEQLKATADAWKALAKAERVDNGVQRFGMDEARNRAFAVVQAARDALRTLGIDPEAP